ncbi:MAG TPA: APC family permease [Xanthomonadales bacterium]|nr:APC family permease [Xanthomonadales bacterium]
MADAARSSEAQLIRAVGLFALTAAIINVVIGGGIFRLPSSIAANMGAAAPMAFIMGAFAIIPITLCFAAAGSRVSSTGGPYTYVAASFGNFAGFVTGALMWIGNVVSGPGVAAALNQQVAHVLPSVAEGWQRAAFFVVLYAIIVAMNAFGVKLGARAIVALATIKLTPLVVLASVGLFFVDWSQVSLTAIPSWPALGASMIMVIFAYSGIETALMPSGEVRDPSRDVPRAALAALLIVVLIYVGIQTVAQGVLGDALPGHTAPLAAAAGRIWPPAFALLLITASVSMFGFLMGNVLGSSRAVYALGRDGYLPSAMARITQRYRVPLNAVLLHAGLGCILAFVGTFDFLIMMSGGANCLVYIAVAIAAWKLQRDDTREHGAPFGLPGGAVAIPLLSVLAMTAILTTLSRNEWIAIAAALFALVLIYAGLRAMRRPVAAP